MGGRLGTESGDLDAYLFSPTEGQFLLRTAAASALWDTSYVDLLRGVHPFAAPSDRLHRDDRQAAEDAWAGLIDPRSPDQREAAIQVRVLRPNQSTVEVLLEAFLVEASDQPGCLLGGVNRLAGDPSVPRQGVVSESWRRRVLAASVEPPAGSGSSDRCDRLRITAAIPALRPLIDQVERAAGRLGQSSPTVDQQESVGYIHDGAHRLASQLDRLAVSEPGIDGGVCQLMAEAIGHWTAVVSAGTREVRSLSHELRAPLNAVIGFADLLAMDQLSREQEAAVAQIIEAGTELTDLIGQMLNWPQASGAGG